MALAKDVHLAFCAQDNLGESPIWDSSTRRLWWIDIRANALFSLRPADGARTCHTLPDVVGSIAFGSDGRLIVALKSGVFEWNIQSEQLEPVSPPPTSDTGFRFNDGRCDKWGNYWLGWFDQKDFSDSGGIFRLSTEGRMELMFSGITIPNGICWSPDGETMYFSDSRQRTIFACTIDETGAVGERRVFAQVAAPGEPDGATVDVDGNMWCAIYGANVVNVYAPDGTILEVIDVPVSQPTSCCFGGDDLSTLYVTTARQRLSEARLAAEPMAGSVLRCDVAARGPAEFRFGQGMRQPEPVAN